jgi:hypothetical protein
LNVPYFKIFLILILLNAFFCMQDFLVLGMPQNLAWKANENEALLSGSGMTVAGSPPPTLPPQNVE